MPQVTVEQIYKAYSEIQEAGEKASEKKESYQILIDGAHGPTSSKRLSARLIPTFFKHFPEYYETAIDALFDLCEDTDLNVRLEVIKAMPNVVKQLKNYSERIADALLQLLQNESAQEIAAVKKALETVIRSDPQRAIRVIFAQTMNGSIEARNRTIKFLAHELNQFKGELFEQDKELEQIFADELKKALRPAEGPEFEIFFKMLITLPMFENNQKNNENLLQELFIYVTEDGKFDLSDEKKVQKLFSCGKAASQILLQKGVSSTSFLIFLSENVLPVDIFSKFNEKQQRTILRFLAECAAAKPDEAKLKDVVPLVKQLLCNEVPQATTDASAKPPALDLSRVEYIIYALYNFDAKVSGLTDNDEVSSRLRHVYMETQKTLSSIKLGLIDLEKRSPKDPETLERIKKCKNGQAMTENIFSMVKELLKPSKFRTYPKITLSWQKMSASSAQNQSLPKSKETKSIKTASSSLPSQSTSTSQKRAASAVQPASVNNVNKKPRINNPTNTGAQNTNITTTIRSSPNNFRVVGVPTNNRAKYSNNVVMTGRSNSGNSPNTRRIIHTQIQKNDQTLYVPPPRRGT
ncbi:6540_t:CDS:10 [Ambispora leptoticha]|uniref:6540_t:CDS:1 n=1 Tax=Ambispora leptoticha TaxID=144679 RepID=A0A9N8YP25_9GLOM|nr:6540_t:CDS:10 [Ambispora leptoticha]